MLVFIDESGDSGFQFDRGSSLYFTVVAVVFPDNFSADACERGIAELRRELRLSSNYEFHFTHCSKKIRQAFFQKVSTEQFKYYAFVLNKRRLFGEVFNDPEQFYRWTVSTVCSNCKSILHDAKITIDKCGDRKFAQRLEASLKSKINDDSQERRVRKVGMQDSCKNDLVQLADMICGAVRYQYGTDCPDSIYCNLIERRKARVQCWPQK